MMGVCGSGLVWAVALIKVWEVISEVVRRERVQAHHWIYDAG
jgi:hypothetical protein